MLMQLSLPSFNQIRDSVLFLDMEAHVEQCSKVLLCLRITVFISLALDKVSLPPICASGNLHSQLSIGLDSC